VDIVDPSARSKMMSRIRSRDTKPEIRVRQFLHRAGFRFRLQVRLDGGRPDIVLTRYRTALFVHGCFWHLHKHCADGRLPKSNTKFWTDKLIGNVKRDERTRRTLRRHGWRVFTIWECQTESATELTRLASRIRRIP
jgi:DNA mismatch endonuclease (patch repair protein)